MRIGICSTFVAAICLGFVPTAGAQQSAKPSTASANAAAIGDPEAGPGASAKPTKAAPLKTDFSLSSEVHSFDNLDFRQLDERSDQAVIDSDDRNTFAYTSMSAKLGYYLNSQTTIGFGVAHSGLWSEDQLGESAERTGLLYFSEAVINYTPLHVSGFDVTMSLGRQPFKIGGVPQDYVLDDTLDALVVNADGGLLGRVRVLALDLYSSNDVPSEASFVDYMGGRNPVLGMRGDTFTARTGAVYENDAALEGLDVKAYYFFADIGGGPIAESGGDVSYGGTLGNFSDNDWAAVAGGRLAYDTDLGPLSVGAFGEGAQSFGVDRKEVIARDVNNEGVMYGGGLTLGFKAGGDFAGSVVGSFYHFDGGTYSSDGMQQSHGFVGFKGKKIGGLALNQYAGWRPSSYVASGGVRDNPNDVNRGAGAAVVSVGIDVMAYNLVGLSANLTQATDSSEALITDFASVDLNDPPFGYSRDEFLAEQRFGEDLGQELDLQLTLKPNDALEIYGVYSTFAPGAFYEIEIEKIAGSALGSSNPQDFWAAMGGAKVTF